MTRVGIVGGLGPESTVDYYRRILEAWEREDPSTAPAIVIDSLDVRRALRLVETDRPALVEYLLASLRRLAGAGADFAAMTANTPHVVFDELAARSPVPLVSIVEVCAREARRRGLGRLALLGTRFTMEGPFYPEVCARHGVAVVPPGDADRAWVHERYVGELLRGEFRDDTRRRLTSLVGRLRDEEGVDGVILGGTELPLLLTTGAVADLPALDTTALHVAAIVERLRSSDSPASFHARTLSASLTVKELRTSLAWYRDVVGFVVDREIEREGELRAVALRAGDVRILINQDDGARGRDRVTGEGFSLMITTDQDVDRVAARIREHGGTLESEPADMPWGARAFRVRDPDGFALAISSGR